MDMRTNQLLLLGTLIYFVSLKTELLDFLFPGGWGFPGILIYISLFMFLLIMWGCRLFLLMQRKYRNLFHILSVLLGFAMLIFMARDRDNILHSFLWGLRHIPGWTA
jgi:hypothetical protein